MIHICGGFPRSGTSAMMAALIAGGMSADWSEERRAFAELHGQPNPYELDEREYSLPDFPLMHHGKLIKVITWGLDNLAVNPEGYRVVLMRRDPVEMEQSFQRAFGWSLGVTPEDYEARMIRARDMLQNRYDVRYVACVHFNALLSDPPTVFEWLKECDWPIDAEAAAATINCKVGA